ncbi:GGDEF domain-containing protein [Dankookia sp. GCM10030260]|uniref:GGDEF domain-containing protein n=1 Tax=Dankookia sp. GCM10030260 TaxID=3273390 RepID=UPI003611E141
MMTDRNRRDQRDALTGTATLPAMHRFLEAALDLSEPQGPRVALLAIGIDGLGSLTARHGPEIGDAALLAIADRLRGGLRAHDLVGRLPEGFCICIPEALTTQARSTAERLQRMLETAPLATPQGPIALRCSLGLALGHGPGSSAQALMDRARAALAAAQEAGGSRIILDQ